MSESYTFGHTKAVLSSHKSRTVGNTAQFLVPYLQPSHHVLDIGCGPGTITAGFAELCHQGRVVGVDQAQSVIEEASKIHPASQWPNLTFEAGDVVSESGLPFPDSSFDIVFTSNTLIHIPDPVKAIKEAYRLVKPGGILAMREPDTVNWYPALPGLELYQRAQMAMVRQTGAPGLDRCRALHAWARQAGFDREKMKVGGSVMTYATPEERQWWAGGYAGRLAADTPTGKVMRALTITWPVTEEGQEEITKAVGEEGIEVMRRDLQRWADDVDGWFGSAHMEVLCWK